MTTIYDVEINLVLARLAENGSIPVSIEGNFPPYRRNWSGAKLNQANGDTWDNAITWVDSNSTKPTEQEMIDEYDAYLVEVADLESDEQTIVDETELYTLVRADYVLAYQLLNQLNQVFVDGNVGNPVQSVLYNGFVSAINGTNLEQPIKDKVLSFTQLTNFATPTDLEKERIMSVAENFLQSLCIVGIVKQFIKL